MESKYRYRGGEKIPTGQQVPTEYWNLKKEGKFTEAAEKIGGKGFGVAKIEGKWEICEIGEKMENPDIADTYNTVLKMAKKRAYVDGILSATAASDIFTQDIEDMNPADLGRGNVVDAQVVPAAGKPQVTMPQEKAIAYADLITLSQAKVGEKLNVSAYGISVSHKQLDKKDKSGKVDISEYVVGDLPKDPTTQLTIKTFGMPLDIGAGTVVKFDGVVVGEFKGARQYLAEVAHA
jgi:hypothetical protein